MNDRTDDDGKVSHRERQHCFWFAINSLLYLNPYNLVSRRIDEESWDIWSWKNSITLHKGCDIPCYLNDNPYILRGYRVSLTIRHCLLSLFIWSNESINIWSHLCGFLLFFWLSIRANLFLIPALGGTVLDHVVISLSLLSFQICMLCSTAYHLFSCHSEGACRRWLSVDLAGVSVAVIGVYLSGIHYSFYCLSVWRDLYLFVIAVLSVATIIVLLMPQYHSSPWFRQRLLIYIALIAYGIIPTVHWTYLNGGMHNNLVQIFVPKVVVMYVIGLISLLLYVSRIPERFYPGAFDYIGSSHQWWHLGMVLALLWWYWTGVEIIRYRLTHVCPSS